jgi:hypothetical protein
MTTAAAIDRLVHHSVTLELNVGSYRLDEAKRRKDGAPIKPSETESWRSPHRPGGRGKLGNARSPHGGLSLS